MPASKQQNLRKLSIAHAEGQIDIKQYRRLRGQQLSALHFAKPVPALPDELKKIKIPKYDVDVPMEAEAGSQANKTVIFVASVIFAVFVIVLMIYALL